MMQNELQRPTSLLHRSLLSYFWLSSGSTKKISNVSHSLSTAAFAAGIFTAWGTQTNCTASEDWRLDEFCPNFLSLLFQSFLGRSWHSSVTGSLSCQLPFFSKATALLSSILFWPFCRLFINLTMCEWAPLPKPATALGLVEQACWRVPLFTKWVISSSFEVILARSSRYSTTRTCASGTSGPRWFSLILPHERIRRRIWWCSFFHDFSNRGGNCNCFLSHTARWFPIANNLQEFFVHAVLFPDSWPRRSSQNFRFWLQSSYFEFLAQYFFSLFFQSVIIRS